MRRVIKYRTKQWYTLHVHRPAPQLYELTLSGEHNAVRHVVFRRADCPTDDLNATQQRTTWLVNCRVTAEEDRL